MNKNQILNTLAEAKPLLKARFGVNTIALFGSYSRNDNTPDSDIDLLAEFETPSYRNLCRACYFLETYFEGTKLQLVTRNAIKPSYFEAIKQDLIYV